MIEAGEQHFIDQCVTHPPVKTLGERILRWLSRGRIMPVNLGVPAPFERRIRGQLSTITATRLVADDRPAPRYDPARPALADYHAGP